MCRQSVVSIVHKKCNVNSVSHISILIADVFLYKLGFFFCFENVLRVQTRSLCVFVLNMFEKQARIWFGLVLKMFEKQRIILPVCFEIVLRNKLELSWFVLKFD